MANFKRQFFGIEFKIEHIQKLLIKHVNELFRNMNIINHHWKNPPGYWLVVVFKQIYDFKRSDFIKSFDF